MSLGLDDLKKANSKKAKPAEKKQAPTAVKRAPAARPWSQAGLAKEGKSRRIQLDPSDDQRSSGLYDIDETVTRSTGQAADSSSIIHRVLEFVAKAEGFIRQKRATACAFRSKFVNPRGR